jgi:hypothetical protein
VRSSNDYPLTSTLRILKHRAQKDLSDNISSGKSELLSLCSTPRISGIAHSVLLQLNLRKLLTKAQRQRPQVKCSKEIWKGDFALLQKAQEHINSLKTIPNVEGEPCPSSLEDPPSPPQMSQFVSPAHWPMVQDHSLSISNCLNPMFSVTGSHA